MNNEYLINELKQDKAKEEAFKQQLSVYQETLKSQLINGSGEQIRKELNDNDKKTLIFRVKSFFKKLLNTL